MKDVRRRWRGLKAFGLAVFATACLTCAPLTAKAGLIGGVGGGQRLGRRAHGMVRWR